VALSDRDLISVTFKDADGRMLEVTGVHPKFPGASHRYPRQALRIAWRAY
jgi:hypothetical protein